MYMGTPYIPHYCRKYLLTGSKLLAIMAELKLRIYVNNEEQQRKIRAAHRDAQKYGLESMLEEELAKEGNNLEYFNLQVKYEKLKKDCKVDKLTYLYIGIVVGIILTLLVAVFFT